MPSEERSILAQIERAEKHRLEPARGRLRLRLRVRAGARLRGRVRGGVGGRVGAPMAMARPSIWKLASDLVRVEVRVRVRVRVKKRVRVQRVSGMVGNG